MFNQYETTAQDTIPNVPPTESEMSAMFSAYHQPPQYTIDSSNLVFCVTMLDDLLHTDAAPWCKDLTCPCHLDEDLRREYADKPIERGHLTDREARRLWLSEVL